MAWISYAQNAEDVRLRRAFRGQAKGFYIDVGANTPVNFSVTKHFYESGWTGIDIQPIDVVCTMPESELARYATRFGPVGRVLDDADEATRDRVVKTVRAEFEPFVHGAEVRYDAACWMIGARAP